MQDTGNVLDAKILLLMNLRFPWKIEIQQDQI